MGDGHQLALEARSLVKLYGEGTAQVQALAGVDLQVAEGEFLAIMGPPGPGRARSFTSSEH